jgi:hypothetical protein
MVAIACAHPGDDRHNNQNGRGHDGHRGNGYGHHKNHNNSDDDDDNDDNGGGNLTNVHNTNHNVNNNTNQNVNNNTNTNQNVNNNTNTNTNQQEQSANAINNVNVALGTSECGIGGVVGTSVFVDDLWRPIYQATPWNPPLAPIRPPDPIEQPRPRIKTYLSPPSFMIGNIKYIIVE